jgi:hypothetical protein
LHVGSSAAHPNSNFPPGIGDFESVPKLKAGPLRGRRGSACLETSVDLYLGWIR